MCVEIYTHTDTHCFNSYLLNYVCSFFSYLLHEHNTILVVQVSCTLSVIVLYVEPLYACWQASFPQSGKTLSHNMTCVGLIYFPASVPVSRQS